MLITIQGTTVPDYQGAGLTAELRIYATDNFFGSGLEHVSGSGYFYKSIECTVAGEQVTIPSFTLQSTTDSTVDTAKYLAVLYDEKGTKVATLNGGDEFSVPPVTPTSWLDINVYNKTVKRRLDTTFYTANQTDALISSKQNVLVSGSTLKTVNSNTLLGSGDVAVQTPLVSGSSIKTVNSTSLLGSGDVAVQSTLVSGTNIKTVNGSSLLGSGDLLVQSYYKLSAYASLATAVTAIGSTKAILEIDSNVTHSVAGQTIPATLFLKPSGGIITKGGSGTITFLGVGLLDADQNIPVFAGFSAGNITWTGSTYPPRISTELWTVSNLLPKLQRATAAMVGNKCTIVCYPALITGGSVDTDAAEINSYHHLYFTDGNYLNTWDTPAYVPILLNDHTSVRSSPGARIYESSVTGAQNQSIIIAKMMVVAGSAGTCTDIYVEDNYFVGEAAQIGSGGKSTVHLGNVINGGINRNTFYRTHGYNVFGGSGSSGNYADGVTFFDNKFIGCGTQVLAIINAKNWQIARNYFDQRNSNATTAYSPFDIEPNTSDDIVSDGIIENNTIDCRDYGHTVAAGIQILGNGNGSAKNITVRHNTIYGTDLITSEITQPLIIPIAMEGVEEAYIYGNTIRGSSQHSIYALNSNHLHIHDNEHITQFGVVEDIFLRGCANSYVYNNSLRKSVSLAGPSVPVMSITEDELPVPITASGSTVTFVGGYWSAYFRDFYPGLKATINNTEFTFSTYTGVTSIDMTVPVGTVATKTFIPGDVTAASDTVNKTGHGFVTGSKVLATTNGVLPGGLPAAGTYGVTPFIIRVDNDNFKFAATLADALANNPCNLADGGSGTHTLVNLMMTKFSSNKYANNEASDGITLDPAGTSEILSTFHDHQVTSVADVAHTATTGEGIIVYTSLTAARTVSLPDATTCRGKEFIVKDGAGAAASFNITLDGNGSQTIDGAATKAISSNYGSLRIKSNGANWFTVVTPGISGSLGTTDNALLRADGTGASTAQGSGATLDDSGTLTANIFQVSPQYFVSVGAGTLKNNVPAAGEFEYVVNGVEKFRVKTEGGFALNRTVTAAGTTGAQTINKPAGTVNIAAGSATVTVTNSLVSSTSLIFGALRTADATATFIKSIVPGAGSFVITLNANATAEVSLAFWVTN